MKVEEEVYHVRDLERQVIQDVTNANNIVELRKTAENSNKAKDVRIAAIHSLRRVFLDYIENNKVAKPVAKAGSSKSPASEKFYNWFIAQYHECQKLLCSLISSSEEWSHALCIRTLMEFVKLDHAVYSEAMKPKYVSVGSNFGIKTFRSLIDAFVLSPNEVDIDLLLMIKDEVLVHNDCMYFAMLHLKALILDVKQQYGAFTKKQEFSTLQASDNAEFQQLEVTKKNLMDTARVLSVPLEVGEDEDFLVPPRENDEGKADSDDESVSSDSDQSDDEEVTSTKKTKKTVDPKSALGKRKAVEEEKKAKKKSKRMSECERLKTVQAYQKLFSKLWLSLLALPFSVSEHKVLLKHLPDNVVPYLTNPLLLADYLTQSYNSGGVVAVLALESLFQLIASYNLDYPNFFASLYKLCKVDIFNAKYSGKFMKLLHASLKSTNLPAYLVAAFIKRLAQLALHAASTRAAFCLAQIIWLLRAHRPCQVLIHRTKLGDAVNAKDDFDNNEEDDLEKSGALQSSLWEIELLENHHIFEVSQLAASIRDAERTSVGSIPINVEKHIDSSYSELIEEDLSKKGKQNAAMAFRKPEALVSKSKVLSAIFA